MITDSIWQLDTEFSADSVECCPIQGYQHIMAIGTYQVDNGENGYTRKGRNYLIHSDEKRVMQQIDANAILDMKWSHYSLQNKPVLVQVTAQGETFLTLLDEDGLLQNEAVAQNLVQDSLVLSVDFQNRVKESFGHNIVISCSNGQVKYLRMCPDGLKESWSVDAHGFEAWTSQFNYYDSNIVYSGGDDSLFRIWDVRSLSCITNKSHQAGVTAISHHPRQEFVLATGSYNESIRIWDTRTMKSPLKEQTTGGGVWRIKWHPEQDLMLAACMYNGFHVFDQDLNLIQSNNNHESIAYGADWSYKDLGLIGTCSFYDHLFTLWRN